MLSVAQPLFCVGVAERLDQLGAHPCLLLADKLPDRLAATVTKRMRQAYHAETAMAAEAQLEALAKELDRAHPGAAVSLREGLSETLTVLRLVCRRRWAAA